MKIQFLMTQDLESPAGIGRYYPLARELVRLGHKVVLSALHPDFKSLTQNSFSSDGIEVHYVGQMHVRKRGNVKSYFNTVGMLQISIAATLQLIRAGLQEAPNVIQVCKAQPMNGIAAWVIHRIRGTPIFLDSDDHEAINNRFSQGWQQKFVRLIENWLPSFARGVTVTNRYLANHFESLGYKKEKIRIVPHGIDFARFSVLHQPDSETITSKIRSQLGFQSKDRILIYVGSMSLLNHAVDILLKAFAELIKSERDIQLLLLGAGEDFNRLKAMAEKMNLSSEVRFTGKIPGKLVPYYYHLADIVIDPKRDTQVAHSSLSIKLFESIAAGIPCVTADTGDSKLILGKAGLAVPPGDHQAIAHGIRTILHDSKLHSAMKEEAAKLRSKYSWENRAAEFIKLYQSQIN